ncbi:MAG TPA: M56 family metallopeptidase, partial [Blastocatellia bacterium]|nr:M56 family metallopeptidase [Blastocatellia bacterium]
MMAYVFMEPAALAREGGWLAWLVALSMKGVLILSVAALIALALRRSAAASRHLVWSLALASLLVLPLLSLALPAWQWSLIPTTLFSQEAQPVSLALSPTAAVSDEQATALRANASPLSADARTHESSIASGSRANASSLESAHPASPNGAPAASPALDSSVAAPTESGALNKALSPLGRGVLGWIQWIIVGWLVGAALVVAHLLVGVARIWRLTRTAETARDAEWLVLVGRLSRRLALTRPVTLRRSARVTMPMACGFVRSSVLLPADVDDWTDERREVVLLHELAHVRRRDCLTQLIAQLACAIYWFNPLVWVAARRLRVERERACDDEVLDAGAKASDYAGHLLDIARSMGAAPTALMAAVAIARRSQLEGRLLAILDPRLRRRALSRAAVTFIAISMICLVLPLAMLRPVGAQTARARAKAKPAVAPQAPGSPMAASPAIPPAPAAAPTPPDAAPAPAEPEAYPEAVLAPAAAPEPLPAAPPAPAAAPQSPASAVAPPPSLSQQDRDALVEGFREALKDDDPEMREQALFSLAQIGGPRATEAIVAALKDSNPEVREKAVWALGMWAGQAQVDAIIAALHDPSAGVREKAAWALGLKGNARSVDALVAALRDENSKVREKAAWSLGLRGNRNAVEPLIESLKDKSADVRATAAWSLGLRGDGRAIKALNAAMKDESHDVRDKARWALGMLLMRSGGAAVSGGEGNNEIEDDVDGRTGAAV